jgi:hypothetical protein
MSTKLKGFPMANQLPNPRWIDPIYEIETGEDFLGLRSVSARITDRLLPGIVTITDRARYYSFFSWLLDEYRQGHPEKWSPGTFIKRREQIFALANIFYTGKITGRPQVEHLNGSDKLTVHWEKYRNANRIPLSVGDYLQAGRGGYNDFAGAMERLNIVRTVSNDTWELWPSGQKLARAFERAIESTRYFKQREKYDTADTVSVDILLEYGEACHLDRLVKRPDHRPLLEVLFAFDAPHQPTWENPETENLENMRGSLGLMLEMLDQAQEPFGDYDFRQAMAYAGCADYAPYKPSEPLHPFLAHWRMYQLREYYVYALYAFWFYFLDWLCQQERAALNTFDTHLCGIDLQPALTIAGIEMGLTLPQEWQLNDWFNQLSTKCGYPGKSLQEQCIAFAQSSQTPLNEHALYLQIQKNHGQDPEAMLGLAWLLLSASFLRLKGVQARNESNCWYWAELGNLRRRSMAGFVEKVDELISSGQTIATAWSTLFREYIISQHIRTCLDKWRNRNANTFHFNYEQGLLEYVRFDDQALTLTASRFDQAATVLFDLGLYEYQEDRTPQLTALGKQTLARVLESISG